MRQNINMAYKRIFNNNTVLVCIMLSDLFIQAFSSCSCHVPDRRFLY